MGQKIGLGFRHTQIEQMVLSLYLDNRKGTRISQFVKQKQQTITKDSREPERKHLTPHIFVAWHMRVSLFTEFLFSQISF